MIIAIASLIIGTLCLFWGYRLLMRGIYADDSKSVWSERSLLIKRSAPGVVFAVFGALMAALPVLRFHERTREPPAALMQEQGEATKPASPSTEPPKRKHAREGAARQRGSAQSEKPSLDSKATPESAPEESTPAGPPAKAWKPGRA